jgi:putative transposase
VFGVAWHHDGAAKGPRPIGFGNCWVVAGIVVQLSLRAPRNYQLQPEAIFHSDRGSQYLSQAFAEAAAQLDVRQSVGSVGSCFDNGLAESFNATLKVERANRTAYPTRARKDVARYIDFRYNTKRLHSALGYRTPRRPTTSTRISGERPGRH